MTMDHWRCEKCGRSAPDALLVDVGFDSVQRRCVGCILGVEMPELVEEAVPGRPGWARNAAGHLLPPEEQGDRVFETRRGACDLCGLVLLQKQRVHSWLWVGGELTEILICRDCSFKRSVVLPEREMATLRAADRITKLRRSRRLDAELDRLRHG